MVGTQRGAATGAKKNTAAAQQPWPSPLLPEETVRLKAVVSTRRRCECECEADRLAPSGPSPRHRLAPPPRTRWLSTLTLRSGAGPAPPLRTVPGGVSIDSQPTWPGRRTANRTATATDRRPSRLHEGPHHSPPRRGMHASSAARKKLPGTGRCGRGVASVTGGAVPVHDFFVARQRDKLKRGDLGRAVPGQYRQSSLLVKRQHPFRFSMAWQGMQQKLPSSS